MAFLSKLGKVRNSTAALIVFMAWFFSAFFTVLINQGTFLAALRFVGIVFGAVLVFMTLMFMLSRLWRRTDIVDLAWPLAFIVIVITSFLINPFDVSFGWNVQTLVSVLVVIWGVRLAVAMSKRLIMSHSEDKRYVALRKTWKGNELANTYLRIFISQAILAAFIAGSVIHVNFALPTVINIFAFVGAGLWLVGFLFESIGDYQLQRHLANPANKGKLMTKGLWRYTRHPNYFGEATMWWGIFIIALQTPFGWLGIVTPVVITYLLLFVSGVPMTEKAFEGRSGWKAYKAQTSKFVPLPPKND